MVSCMPSPVPHAILTIACCVFLPQGSSAGHSRPGPLLGERSKQLFPTPVIPVSAIAAILNSVGVLTSFECIIDFLSGVSNNRSSGMRKQLIVQIHRRGSAMERPRRAERRENESCWWCRIALAAFYEWEVAELIIFNRCRSQPHPTIHQYNWSLLARSSNAPRSPDLSSPSLRDATTRASRASAPARRNTGSSAGARGSTSRTA